MEKFNFTFSDFSLQRTKAVFRNALSRTFTPDQLWQAVLWGAALVAIVIAVIAFVNYRWALSRVLPEEVPEEVPGNIEVFSIKEMQEVIELYEAKKSRFEQLKQKTPATPDLSRGAGAKTATENPAVESRNATSSTKVVPYIEG